MSQWAMESFNVSFEIRACRAESGPRVVAPPLDVHPLGPDRFVVQPVVAAAPQTVDALQLTLLQACNRLDALENHAVAATQGPARIDRERARRVLHGLHRQGLLIDEQGLGGLIASDARCRPGPLKSLFIRSSGRPRTLQQALKSLAASTGSVQRCIVLDDTRDNATRARIDRCVSEMRARLPIRLRHFKRAQREALIDRLAQQGGLERNGLAWFVQGSPERDDGYGCGLNLALLLSAGERFMLLDDDASLAAVGTGGESSPARIDAGHALRGMVLTPETEGLFTPLERFDPIARHAAVLGDPIAPRESAAPAFGGMTPEAVLALRPGMRTRLTGNGVWGDPGTRQPHWLYAQPASTLDPWEDQRDYVESLAARRTARYTSTPRHIVEYSFMTTTLSGIDNSDALLPTLPCGPGEDTFFGELVRVRLECEYLRQAMSRRAGFAAGLAERRDSLPDWPHLQHDIDALIAANSIADWHEDDRPDSRLAAVKAVATGYARGLDDWRLAWQAARELGSEALLK